MSDITIVDWFSLGIAIAAFLISGYVSIRSLYISYKTYHARYRPYLVPLKKDNFIFIIQNIGNGPAINPYVDFYHNEELVLEQQPLHHLPAGYYCEINLEKKLSEQLGDRFSEDFIISNAKPSCKGIIDIKKGRKFRQVSADNVSNPLPISNLT